MIFPVILCVVSGTRLWPLSRKAFPKQFSKFLGSQSLFQQAVSRLNGSQISNPIIVTGNEYRFIVKEQLQEINLEPKTIIIEPSAKNTAPAILAAALVIAENNIEDLMLVMPSDHIIPNKIAFNDAVSKALITAQQGNIVTFGIFPTQPETGYGYLELSENTDINADYPQKLDSFIEKPNLEKAIQLLLGGKHLWNAGIFLFKASTIIELFKKFEPELLEVVSKSIEMKTEDIGFTRLGTVEWEKAKSISIDYAIMEKAKSIYAMPYSFGWSDLGGWEAVWQESSQDANNNVISANVTAIDCKNSLLRTDGKGVELVGIGLENIIAIAMNDAVLITNKNEAQNVKNALEVLISKGASQATDFPFVRRPWGSFETIAAGKEFQVKRIIVKPGQSLSLQSHAKRAEHWIVVEGRAKVIIDNEVKFLEANESIYIPIGAKHRLENSEKNDVILIEVQTGSYLGEDDIIRYDDIYMRQ